MLIYKLVSPQILSLVSDHVLLDLSVVVMYSLDVNISVLSNRWLGRRWVGTPST